MGLTGNRPTLALIPVALVVLLSSCGGGDNSSKPAARASGPTATASKPAGPSSGTTGTTGASRPKRSKRTRKHQGTAQTEPPSSSGDANSDAQKRKSSRKAKKKTNSKDEGPGPRADFTAQEFQLYQQSKIVCRGLGIDALAKQYHVEKNPKDVATAYADAYGKTFGKGTRNAVYRGCRTGLAGQ